MPLPNVLIIEMSHCKVSHQQLGFWDLYWSTCFYTQVHYCRHKTRAYSDCMIPLVLNSLCHLRSFWKTPSCLREFPSPTNPSVRTVWRQQGRMAGSAPTSPLGTRYTQSFLLQFVCRCEKDTTEKTSQVLENLQHHNMRNASACELAAVLLYSLDGLFLCKALVKISFLPNLKKSLQNKQ